MKKKLTKADLLASINLNQRDLEAFGGMITIRDLTISEMMDIDKVEDDEKLFKMVSMAIVSPKITANELKGLSFEGMDDLNKIIKEITPSIG